MAQTRSLDKDSKFIVFIINLNNSYLTNGSIILEVSLFDKINCFNEEKDYNKVIT